MKKILAYITISTMLAIFFAFKLYSEFKVIYALSEKKIYSCFFSAIMQECKIRINLNSTFIVRVESSEYITNEYFLDVSEDKVEKILKNDEVKKMDYDKRTMMGDQTYLAEKKAYINVQNLDSLFKNVLLENHLDLQTGLKFINNINSDTIYFTDSNIAFHKVQKTDPIVLGIKQEASVQAYYELNLWKMRNELTSQFFYLLLIVIFLLLGIIYCSGYAYYKWKKAKESIPKDRIEILPNVFFYRKKFLLQGKYCEVTLTAQMVTLFDLFAADPGRFASSTQISEVLWEKIDDTNDRLTQLIKRTRDQIAPLIEIKIENISGMGYRLVLSGK